jgi:hypothetical protein
MIKMPDTKGKYFSVKYRTKIQGVHYTPSVCYPLPLGLQTVIEEMTVKDMAKIYMEKVRFVTGVPYPVKKLEIDTAGPRPSSVSTPDIKTDEAVRQVAKKTSAVSPARPGRKSVRSGYITQANREFD